MDRNLDKRSLTDCLYPNIAPYCQQSLPVSDGHILYVEQCGNPSGIPVLVLHGGPGGGCTPLMRRFFDPNSYRIILFDQRGCGRSRPYASTEHNTTGHLIDDIEAIRVTLGIDDWVVFGGSWGATLGLLYAQKYPHQIRHLVLRGVFLMTPSELDWFYGGGAGTFWPEAWEMFRAIVPEEERSDLILAYHRRLFSGNSDDEERFSREWFIWERQLSTMERSTLVRDCPKNYARAFSRLETHYFVNDGFLDEPDYIMNRMHRLKNVPGTIVQGRFDFVCPPGTAYDLSKCWPAATLEIVNAGHAITEMNISLALLRTMDSLR